MAAVSDVGRWILFQYLIVFVPSYRNPTLLTYTIFSDPVSLYAKHFKAIILVKHRKHFKVSSETSKQRTRGKEKERNKLSAAENYSDYANTFSSTSFAICSMSTPHLGGKIYSKGVASSHKQMCN